MTHPRPTKTRAMLQLDTWPTDRKSWVVDSIVCRKDPTRIIVSGAYKAPALAAIASLPWHIPVAFQYVQESFRIGGKVEAATTAVYGAKYFRRIILTLFCVDWISYEARA